MINVSILITFSRNAYQFQLNMRYMFCVCLHIVRSNTHCVVFLFCFSLSCLLYVASFSGLSLFIVPSVFSNLFSQAHLTICINFLVQIFLQLQYSNVILNPYRLFQAKLKMQTIRVHVFIRFSLPILVKQKLKYENE